MAANDITTLQENASARFINRTRPAYAGGLDANSNPTITPGTSAEVLRYTVDLTGNRTVTCSNTGAWTGARFRIIRVDVAAFTLDVKNHGGSTLKQIASTVAAFVDVVHDGTDWQLAAYGAL